MYQNAILTKTASFPGDIRSDINTPVWIGGKYGTEYFNGLIDEVRMYNRALSEAEIKAIYNATK